MCEYRGNDIKFNWRSSIKLAIKTAWTQRIPARLTFYEGTQWPSPLPYPPLPAPYAVVWTAPTITATWLVSKGAVSKYGLPCMMHCIAWRASPKSLPSFPCPLSPWWWCQIVRAGICSYFLSALKANIISEGMMVGQEYTNIIRSYEVWSGVNKYIYRGYDAMVKGMQISGGCMGHQVSGMHGTHLMPFPSASELPAGSCTVRSVHCIANSMYWSLCTEHSVHCALCTMLRTGHCWLVHPVSYCKCTMNIHSANLIAVVT